MPRDEVAALALFGVASVVWLVGAFVGSVSSLRVLAGPP
jgi:hypothetical protein